MRTTIDQQSRRAVEYDALRRRVWIFGQRCHHGATGSVIAALACVGLLAELPRARRVSAEAAPLFALIATGGALMAHDWKDHAFWFERGYGTQS